MFNKIKELKNLRDQAKKIKTSLAEETVHAESLGGKINIIMDGNMEILTVEINPELLQSDQKETLENGIKEASNSAVKKAQQAMAKKMQGMNGLNIPGM